MTENEINAVYIKINEQFKLNIDLQLKGLGYRFDRFYKIHDIINARDFYSVGIENTNLNFQDRNGLIEVLIKFVDREIANIPNELESLEEERAKSRYWDDTQHFYETEALSEKEGKLSKLKTKLLKELNKSGKL
jgi:hypothetical protein